MKIIENLLEQLVKIEKTKRKLKKNRQYESPPHKHLENMKKIFAIFYFFFFFIRLENSRSRSKFLEI